MATKWCALTVVGVATHDKTVLMGHPGVGVPPRHLGLHQKNGNSLFCNSITDQKWFFPYKSCFLATKWCARPDFRVATQDTTVPLGHPSVGVPPQHLGWHRQSENSSFYNSISGQKSVFQYKSGFLETKWCARTVFGVSRQKTMDPLVTSM